MLPRRHYLSPAAFFIDCNVPFGTSSFVCRPIGNCSFVIVLYQISWFEPSRMNIHPLFFNSLFNSPYVVPSPLDNIITRTLHVVKSFLFFYFQMCDARNVVENLNVVPRSAPLLGLPFQSSALKRQCGENSCFPRTLRFNAAGI